MSNLIVIPNGLWGTPETIRGVGLMEQLHEITDYHYLTRENLEQAVTEILGVPREREFRFHTGSQGHAMFQEALQREVSSRNLNAELWTRIRQGEI